MPWSGATAARWLETPSCGNSSSGSKRAQASSSRHGGTTTWQWGLGGEDPLLNPRAQVSQKDCRLSNWVRRKFTPMAVTSMMKVSTPLNF